MGNSANNSSSVKFFSARFRVLVWCCVIVFTRSSQCFKMTTYGSLWCLRHCNCQWARLILPQPRPQILLEWVRALGRGWLFPRTSLLVREKKAVKALCARQAAQCWRALATDVRISGRMSDFRTDRNYMASCVRPSIRGGSLIAKKYRCLGQIGEGSFGVIFLGKNEENREQVAIKIEYQHSSQPKTLLDEARLLSTLHRASGNGIAVRKSLKW